MMNQVDFLNNQDVQEFVDYMASWIDNPKGCINLNIPPSPRVPGGLRAHNCTVNDVLNEYCWRASWTHPIYGRQVSLNWPNTLASLNLLSQYLRTAVAINNDDNVLDACRQVLIWGGNRNWNRGAWPFLEHKARNSQLSIYLSNCSEALSLPTADIDVPNGIENMNAMLTKVHSLLSVDGLPIYDSRVAVAIGTLVEIYRRGKDQPNTPVSPALTFPATAIARTVHVLFPDAPCPGFLYYGAPNTAQAWASAKVRLGWLLRQVLDRSQFMDKEDMPTRMHALEAVLFMIGYDVTCLAACAGVDPPAKHIKPRPAPASKGKSSKPSLDKTALTLGRENKFNYGGDLEHGFRIGYTKAPPVYIDPEMVNDALDAFAGTTVLGGFNLSGPPQGSFGEWVTNYPNACLSPKHASRIAAILVAEGVINSHLEKRAVVLVFPP